ncbi:translation initiation factor IF-1 [Candidatus Kaiserbacteria bacterium]|nr:translation initiation factor IF-1 [Candidatus Kaiserbacteria bacterium]
MSEGEETKTTVIGTVEEVLPDSLFRVRLSAQANPPSEALAKEGEASEELLVLAYLAGKMRLHRIRVLMGDQVEMVLDPYGGRARIVRRLT